MHDDLRVFMSTVEPVFSARWQMKPKKRLKIETSNQALLSL
jgi:hypothetical protein